MKHTQNGGCASREKHKECEQKVSSASESCCGKLKDDLKAAREQADEYKEQLQRVQAEYENYIKRTKREMELIQERGSEEVLLRIADIYQDMTRALEVKETEGAYTTLHEGLMMIASHINKLLQEYGIAPIPVQGKVFDPELHEALLVKKVQNEPENIVVEELQRGYTMKNRVIRHAKVKITRRE